MKKKAVMIFITMCVIAGSFHFHGSAEASDYGSDKSRFSEKEMKQTGGITDPHEPQDPHNPQLPLGPGGEDLLDNDLLQTTSALDQSTREARSVGEPDDYGYTWDDTTNYEWIDAKALGTNIGIYGGDVTIFEPIALGFPFPFYENSYSEVYVSTKGQVNFDMAGLWYDPMPIPSITTPNNFIAPLWEDLGIYSGGNRPEAGIYYLTGGIEPERYAVIEWYRADIYSGEQNFGYELLDLTFEIVFYENGDIVLQYNNIPTDQAVSLFGAEVGIENSDGTIGLSYPSATELSSGLAISFDYPSPSQRIYLTTDILGQFANPTEVKDFIVHLQNSGDLGDDTFEFSIDSIWPMTVFERAGMTEVTEPITLSQGQIMDFIVRVQTPENGRSGEMNVSSLTVTSIKDSTISKTLNWTLAVPASFTQIISDSGDDYQPAALFVRPDFQTKVMGGLAGSASDLAVAELPNRDSIYFSGINFCGDASCSISQYFVYYWILDRYGEVVLSPTLLSEASDTTCNIYDVSLSLDVNNNGEIGVVWTREKQKLDNEGNTLYMTNILYAILNQDGSIKVPQTNITKYWTWSPNGEMGSTIYGNPKIAASDDGNFTIGWSKRFFRPFYHLQYIEDIILCVVDNTGNFVMNPTLATESRNIFGYTLIYIDLTLTAVETVNGNQIFITWTEASVGVEGFYLKVLWQESQSSVRLTDGTVFYRPWLLQDYFAWNPDTTQLSNGKIMLAADDYDAIQIVVYDINTQIPKRMLFTIPLPEALYGDKYISVTRDQEGRGIITWGYANNGSSTSRNLGYMLVDSDGNVVTEPMLYYQAGESSYETRYVAASTTGNGVSTFRYNIAPEFTSIPDDQAYSDIPYSYEITSTDIDLPDDVLTITARNLPSWLSFTDFGDGTGLLSGNPSNLDLCEYNIELTVEDTYGFSDTQSFILTVYASEAPAFTSAETALFAEGFNGTCIVETSGLPAPIIGYSGTLPNNVVFTDNGDGTATLSGIPEVGTGMTDYPITFSASNGIAPEASQSFILTVGIPPEFDSGDSAFGLATVGEYVEFYETVAGYPENPEITITGNLPAGMYFSDLGTGTASIVGTPEMDTGGIYCLTLTADNGTSVVDILEYTLIVKTVKVIGPAGGTISSSAGEITLQIPPESLTEEITFEFFPLPEPTEQIPSSLAFAGIGFKLIARMGEQEVFPSFDPPMKVEIHYDETELSGLPEDGLILYYWDSITSTWLDAASTCPSSAGYNYFTELDYFTLEVCHLTEFAVMGDNWHNIFIPLFDQ